MIRQSATVLRILQVSDCHVSASPRADYRGVNPDENLRSLLPVLRRWQPELVLLTGDVSEDASPAAYGRVSAMLGTLGAPVLALPGNHDDPAVMQRYFPSGPWRGPFAHSGKGWQLILLDSAVSGQISGALNTEDLERLELSLRRSSPGFALVVLHHHPVPMNAPWIDRYPLERPETFFELVDRFPGVRGVVWGHVHQAFESARDGVLMLGGPSTAANSLPKTMEFTRDLSGPACRWLELGGNGAIRTGVTSARGV